MLPKVDQRHVDYNPNDHKLEEEYSIYQDSSSSVSFSSEFLEHSNSNSEPFISHPTRSSYFHERENNRHFSIKPDNNPTSINTKGISVNIRSEGNIHSLNHNRDSVPSDTINSPYTIHQQVQLQKPVVANVDEFSFRPSYRFPTERPKQQEIHPKQYHHNIRDIINAQNNEDKNRDSIPSRKPQRNQNFIKRQPIHKTVGDIKFDENIKIESNPIAGTTTYIIKNKETSINEHPFIDVENFEGFLTDDPNQYIRELMQIQHFKTDEQKGDMVKQESCCTHNEDNDLILFQGQSGNVKLNQNIKLDMVDKNLLRKFFQQNNLNENFIDPPEEFFEPHKIDNRHENIRNTAVNNQDEHNVKSRSPKPIIHHPDISYNHEIKHDKIHHKPTYHVNHKPNNHVIHSPNYHGSFKPSHHITHKPHHDVPYSYHDPHDRKSVSFSSFSLKPKGPYDHNQKDLVNHHVIINHNDNHHKKRYGYKNHHYSTIQPYYTTKKPSYSYQPYTAYTTPKKSYVTTKPPYYHPSKSYSAQYHTPKPHHHTPKPYHHTPKPYYHSPKPHHHTPKPYHHTPKPYHHSPKSHYHKPKAHPTPKIHHHGYNKHHKEPKAYSTPKSHHPYLTKHPIKYTTPKYTEVIYTTTKTPYKAPQYSHGYHNPHKVCQI